jgi:hypothetical protein
MDMAATTTIKIEITMIDKRYFIFINSSPVHREGDPSQSRRLAETCGLRF